MKTSDLFFYALCIGPLRAMQDAVTAFRIGWFTSFNPMGKEMIDTSKNKHYRAVVYTTGNRGICKFPMEPKTCLHIIPQGNRKSKKKIKDIFQ